MSAHGEIVLLSRLSEVESLEELATSGMPLSCVPTERLREVVEWSLKYYFDSARKMAPTREALNVTWGERLSDEEVELIDPEESDTMSWAIEDLISDYARSQVQSFTRDFATATAPKQAHALELPEIIHDFSGRLIDLDMSLTSDHAVVPVGMGLDQRIEAYERRAGGERVVGGLLTGYAEIDEHTGGIHPGEAAVIGAPAKLGKSFALADIAKNAWEAGNSRPVLFTLENSKDMTLDRIAVLGSGVDAQRFERGQLTDAEIARVREFRDYMGDDIFVVQPGEGERTVAAMHRQTQLLEGTAMIVDQLTWVEHPKPDSRRARNIEVREILMQFAYAINGREPMPLLLAHQINRDGIERARKLGYLEMTMFADSSEVERIVTHAFGLYQSRDNMVADRLLFQTIVSRKYRPKHWLMSWNLSQGNIGVIRETELPNSAE